MCNYLKLPTMLFAENILSTFLEMKDFVKLDSSICNHYWRSQLLDCFSYTKIYSKMVISCDEQCIWLKKKRISMCDIVAVSSRGRELTNRRFLDVLETNSWVNSLNLTHFPEDDCLLLTSFIEYIQNNCKKLKSFIYSSENLKFKISDIQDLATSCQNLETLNISCSILADSAPNKTSNNESTIYSENILNFILKCEEVPDRMLDKIFIAFPNLHTIVLKETHPENKHSILFSNSYAFKLTSLIISSSRITDDTVRIITEACMSLRILHIVSPKITDSAVRMITATYPTILELKLSSAKITDIGLQTIGNSCPMIERLAMDHCTTITNNGIKYISTCKLLNKLQLNYCFKLTEEFISSSFLKNHRLLTLELSYCNITDSGLFSLARCCPQLQELNIYGCKDITDIGLSHLANGCFNLIKLDLRSAFNITDEGIRLLSLSCQQLRFLDVTCSSNLTDMSLFYISTGFRLLRTLILCYCREITDKGLEYLACGNQELENISLALCFRITEYGVTLLLKCCKRIMELDLGYCGISEGFLKKIRRISPGINLCKIYPSTPGYFV